MWQDLYIEYYKFINELKLKEYKHKKRDSK